ncbi:[4Fe-4S] proteins maturation [Sporothrix stenoceras]|uniref:[4Fe-4S] proteins maturation n=1 Tax=Sporothrix stenoceras TaxID=5173 RepID=A0ABR3ZIV4_9PEZI
MSIPMCSHALAAASAPKSIMHLRKALRLVPATSSSPILDFLLPPSTSSLFVANTSRRGYATAPSTSESHTGARQHKSLSSRRQQTSPLSTQTLSSWTTLRSSAMQPRSFSTTSRRANTQTLLNPQKDDDGNEMRLEITSRAAKRLAKVMEKDANNRLALRIQVESGGCHGFQYVMSLVTLPEKLPEPAELAEGGEEGAVIREDDTIFAYAGEEALSAESAADPLALPKIILDTPSLELLNGSKVDFTMELIGSQFKIVDNPAATSSCGCGTSFDIKI